MDWWTQEPGLTMKIPKDGSIKPKSPEEKTLNDIIRRLRFIHQEVGRYTSNYNRSNGRLPHVGEILSDNYMSSLMAEKDNLISNFRAIVQRAQSRNQQYQEEVSPNETILSNAIKSISAKVNPFESYQMPNFAYNVKNVFTEMKKRGSLIDPSYNITNISPTPYMKKYYNTIRRWW